MNSDLSISSVSPLPMRQPDTSSVSKAKEGFEDLLVSTIDQVNQAQLKSDSAIQQLATGKAEHLHDVMVSVEEADTSLRMLVQLRNKVQDAYNEIMRLSI